MSTFDDLLSWWHRNSQPPPGLDPDQIAIQNGTFVPGQGTDGVLQRFEQPTGQPDQSIPVPRVKPPVPDSYMPTVDVQDNPVFNPAAAQAPQAPQMPAGAPQDNQGTPSVTDGLSVPSAALTASRRDQALAAFGLPNQQQQQAAPQDDSFGARLDRGLSDPDNSQRLLALASGLLGGGSKRPSERWGAAFGAVGKAGQEAQTDSRKDLEVAAKFVDMGIPPERALAYVKGKDDLKDLFGQGGAFAGGMGLGKQQQGNMYYGPDNKTAYREVFNPRGGRVGFMNYQTGQMQSTLPEGSFRAEDSAVRKLNNGDADAANGIIDAARAAPAKIADIQGLRGALTGVTTGGDVMSQFSRYVSQKSGVPFNGNDPAMMDMARQQFAKLKLEAAGIMKGQGQISDAERRLLGDSVSSMDTNPEALKSVLSVLEGAENRKVSKAQDWYNTSPTDRQRGFREWEFNWDKTHLNPRINVEGQPSAATGGTTQSGIKWSIVK